MFPFYFSNIKQCWKTLGKCGVSVSLGLRQSMELNDMISLGPKRYWDQERIR